MLLARLSLTLSFYSRAHCAPLGTAHLSFSARHVRPLFSEANECIQKPPRVLLIIGCAFGPRKASKVEKLSSRGVNSLYRWSLILLPVLWLMPLCALCTHVCVSTTLCLLSFASLPHCWSFPELGPMTQTDLSASMCYILTSLNERTNRSETLHGTGSLEEMVPLRVHMLSIDYRNYQIQKI